MQNLEAPKEEVENAARRSWIQFVELANDTLLGKFPGKRVMFASRSKLMFATDATSVPSIVTMFLHVDWKSTTRDAAGRVIPVPIRLDDVVKVTLVYRREV